MKNSIIYITFTLLTAACSSPQQQDGLITYDLDQEFPEKTLSLDELMDEPKLVRLEKTEESLIPQRFSFYIGEKHFVVWDSDKMLLFDREGTFLRKLADRGKGPGEFGWVRSIVFGSGEDLLYLADNNTPGSLSVFETSSGKFSYMEVPMPVQSMVGIGEDRILALGHEEDVQTIFEMNFQTGETNEIRRWTVSRSYHPLFFKGKVGEDLFAVRNDTVFRYHQGNLLPIAFFSLEGRANPATFQSGYRLAIDGLAPGFFLLEKTMVAHERVTENEGRVRPGRPLSLYVDRKTHKIMSISYRYDLD